MARGNSIVCINCDSYIPSYLGVWFDKPIKSSKPWQKDVEYTGRCRDCKESRRAFRRKARARYKEYLRSK